MMMKIEQKIEKHKKFLELKEVDRPLCGCCIGGWESLSRYTKDPGQLFPKGYINADRINTKSFLDTYESFMNNIFYDDDLIRTVEPLPWVPWTEAAAGCPVNFTGKNLWAGTLNVSIDEAYIQLYFKDENAWLHKYGEFLDLLKNHFKERYPLGQAVLRGPLDMAAAAIGDENLVYKLIDRPDTMKQFISSCSEIFMDFLQLQITKTPRFYNGYVIGQYYIWTPGTCARLQEDSMCLLSPVMYEEFAMNIDRRISQIADYNLFHSHATSMFLIDYIIEMKSIQIIQVSKDEGNVMLEDLIGSLEKIQAAGKCLVLKGRFTKGDYETINKKLDNQGLCVQSVVNSVDEAEDVMALMDSIYS